MSSSNQPLTSALESAVPGRDHAPCSLPACCWYPLRADSCASLLCAPPAQPAAPRPGDGVGPWRGVGTPPYGNHAGVGVHRPAPRAGLCMRLRSESLPASDDPGSQPGGGVHRREARSRPTGWLRSGITFWLCLGAGGAAAPAPEPRWCASAAPAPAVLATDACSCCRVEQRASASAACARASADSGSLGTLCGRPRAAPALPESASGRSPQAVLAYVASLLRSPQSLADDGMRDSCGRGLAYGSDAAGARLAPAVCSRWSWAAQPAAA